MAVIGGCAEGSSWSTAARLQHPLESNCAWLPDAIQRFPVPCMKICKRNNKAEIGSNYKRVPLCHAMAPVSIILIEKRTLHACPGSSPGTKRQAFGYCMRSGREIQIGCQIMANASRANPFMYLQPINQPAPKSLR